MKNIFTFVLLLCTAPLTYASTSSAMKEAEKAPLEIDSRDGLKCDREKLYCTAEGEVIVRKGPYEMHSKKANAFMKKNEEGKIEIRKVEAIDDVKFFGVTGEKATSEHATYDLDTQRIDLEPGKGHQVVVWKDEYVMLADFIYIYFKEGEDNKIELDRIDAKGHISLSSPDELIEGDHATLTPQDKLIVVTGDVRANRKQGQLRGSYAQVNLDTKRSKVLKRKGVNTDDRVRVFVYPDEVDRKSLKIDPLKNSKGSVTKDERE